MMGEEIFTNLNTSKIASIIRKSKARVIFVAPGLNDNIADALLTVKDFIDINNITIIVDSSPDVIRMGYGDIDFLGSVLDANLNVKKTEGIRTGFLCSDDTAYIFTPIPLIAEDENSVFPNAFLLNDDFRDAVINKIIPSNISDDIEPAIGKEKLTKQDFSIAKEDIKTKPFVKPDLHRKIRVISSLFCFVETEFKGARIEQYKYSLTPEQLGISNNEIGRRIKANYRIFDNIPHLDYKVINFDYNAIKKKFLINLPKYGNILFWDKQNEFLIEISKLKENVKSFQANAKEKIEIMLNRQKPLIKSLIIENYKRIGILKLLDELSLSNKSELEDFVSFSVDQSFPNADTILKDMEITFIIKNISDTLLEDENFVKTVENKLNKSIHELIENFNALKEKIE